MWTCEISTTSGVPMAAASTSVVPPEVGHAVGERRVGQHPDAAQLDQHAGVAEPRQGRGGLARGPRAGAVRASGSHGSGVTPTA